MNTKNCYYRDCVNTSLSSKLTFFGFPVKDTQKCKLWSDRAGCETDNLKNKYLCEDHFSHIYISRTARRTVLLPNAVPFHWDDDNSQVHLQSKDASKENDKDKNDTDYEDTVTEMLFIDGNGKDVIISEENNESINNNKVITDDCSDDTKPVDDDHLPVMKKFYNKTGPMSYGNDFTHITKRQKLQTSAKSFTLARPSLDSTKSLDNHENVEENRSDPIDNTANNPDITTFIYKGEEYIQMPKRVYIQQRTQLDADIKRLRETLRNIKALVIDLD